jgi:tRNA(Ile)-lysidine synthase
MKLNLSAGKYVVAVSGGVDSMALLDMMSKLKDVRLVVAHFDHGIRKDSAEDRRLVQRRAKELNLPFTFAEGELGPKASEAVARRARYEFLREVRRAAAAQAIVTAHHQDDVLETALINLLRGTGRRGLSALDSTGDLVRPLLNAPKEELREYAKQHNLTWREDSSNQDTRFLRNYVRLAIMPRFSTAQRQRLLDMISKARDNNRLLDNELANYLHVQPHRGELNRADFIQLPHTVAREVLAGWLRANGLRHYDSKTLERLVASAKTGHSGTYRDVLTGWTLKIGKHALALQASER